MAVHQVHPLRDAGERTLMCRLLNLEDGAHRCRLWQRDAAASAGIRNCAAD
jgi:hypothetical protein